MIIGLIGKARSGKSTLAAHLVSAHGFVEVSFAAKLKEMVVNELLKFPAPGAEKITYAELYDEFYVNRTPGSRWLLQFIGTNIVRQVDPNFWVKQAPLTHFADVAVSDARFPNECAAIKEAGGIIVRVVRESGAGKIEHGAAHTSETALDNYAPDYTITAHDGVEGLQGQMDDLLQVIKKKSAVGFITTAAKG